jgi:hypothetical protein
MNADRAELADVTLGDQVPNVADMRSEPALKTDYVAHARLVGEFGQFARSVDIWCERPFAVDILARRNRSPNAVLVLRRGCKNDDQIDFRVLDQIG